MVGVFGVMLFGLCFLSWFCCVCSLYLYCVVSLASLGARKQGTDTAHSEPHPNKPNNKTQTAPNHPTPLQGSGDATCNVLNDGGNINSGVKQGKQAVSFGYLLSSFKSLVSLVTVLRGELAIFFGFVWLLCG